MWGKSGGKGRRRWGEDNIEEEEEEKEEEILHAVGECGERRNIEVALG